MLLKLALPVSGDMPLLEVPDPSDESVDQALALELLVDEVSGFAVLTVLECFNTCSAWPTLC